MKETNLPLLVVSPSHWPAIGEPSPGGRTFRRVGSAEGFRAWFETVWEVCSPEGALSPGAVALFAGVSRAGVHKRIKEGRLTAFMFYLVDHGDPDCPKTLADAGGRPYTYIPLVECRAWTELLNRRPTGPQIPLPRTQDDDSWRQW